MKKKFFLMSFLVIFCSSLLFVTVYAQSVFASDDSVMSRWTKTTSFREPGTIGSFEIKVIYYAAEYIEALLNQEAQKNLWTATELEQYKYELMKTIQLDEFIPFLVEFENNGPSMHLAPFDRQVVLWVGNKKYVPADYDKRFNFRLQGKRDGMIFFPRYDEKGKPILQGAKTIRLSFNGGIHAFIRTNYIDFFWDVDKDNPERLYGGSAATRLELDRLIKRIEKLNAEKRDLENKLTEVNNELSTINKRVEELQKQ